MGIMLMLMGSAVVASANPVPEVDGNSAVSALVLLSGGLLMVSRRRKK